MSHGVRRALRLACAMCAIAAFAGPADGAPNCTVSATSVNFGTYNVFDTTANDTTGTVSYRCTGNTSVVSITLSAGSSTGFSPRNLTGTADTLTYNLFTDAARTSIWGDGTGSTASYQRSSPPNNTTITVTVYARIPASQDVQADTYRDNITVTINF
jgi:spore coat protein U-like protein